MARRRSKLRHAEEEHENGERWLLTYADMITLLVAFFIMLYSMSVMNQAKFQQLAISVRSGFGQTVVGGAPTVFSRGGGVNGTPAIINSSKSTPSNEDFIKDARVRQDADALDKAYAAVKAYIEKNGLKDAMHVTRNERRDRHRHDRQDAVRARPGRPAPRRVGPAGYRRRRYP